MGERQPSKESKMKIRDFWVSKSTDVNKLNITLERTPQKPEI